MATTAESRRLETLDAVHRALSLDEVTIQSSDDAVPVAQALMAMPAKLWKALGAVRVETLSGSSMAGLHPILQRVLGWDPSIWTAINTWAKGFAGSTKEMKAFTLQTVAMALTPRDLLKTHSIEEYGRLSDEDEEDARESLERFYYNYVKHRPALLKTQADVAKAAGISVGTVIAIEKLRTQPHHATVVKIAKAFGVKPEDLLAPLDR
jgi:DNA-binding XRE family transcriptional regulator